MSHTGDKNENIFLWLLEQDRQKNRARVLRETNRNSAVRSPSTPNELFLDSEKFRNDEGNRSTHSVTTALEQVMKERADLQKESHQLSEEQRRLTLQIKVARLLIQEMKKTNSELQVAIYEWQTRIGKLETQFGKLLLSDGPMGSEAGKIDNKPNKPASEASQERPFDFGQNGIAVNIIKKIK